MRIGLAVVLFGLAVAVDSAAWAQRAVGDQVQAADRASSAGENDKAVELYSKAIRSGKLAKSDLARTFLRRGRAQAAKGAHARAVADFTNALWLESLSNDDAARALALRGVSRQAMKQGKAALGDLAQAVAKAPSLPNIYMNRGVVFAARSQPDKAIADFDKAISLGGSEVYRAYYEKGLVQQATGKRKAASASFSQSLRLRPGFGPAQAKLAELGGGGAAPVARVASTARVAAPPANSTSSRSTSLLDNIFGPTGDTATTPQHTPGVVQPSPANPVRVTALPQNRTGTAAPANPTRLDTRQGAGVARPRENTVNNANLLNQILGPAATARHAVPIQPGAPQVVAPNPTPVVQTNAPRQLTAGRPVSSAQNGPAAGSAPPSEREDLLANILGANRNTAPPRPKPGDSATPIAAQPAPVVQRNAPVRLSAQPLPAAQPSSSFFGRIFGTPEPRRPSPARIAPANQNGAQWSTKVAAGGVPAPSAPPPQPRPSPLDRVAELEWSQTTTIKRAPRVAPVRRAAPVQRAVPVKQATPVLRGRPAPKATAVHASTRVASRSTSFSGTFGSEVASATKAVTSTVSEWLSGASDAPPPASARKIRRRTTVAKKTKRPKPRKPKTRRTAPAKVAVKASEGGYVVQVSAQKSLAAAQGVAKRVSARHGDLFGSAKPYIIKAQVSGKGTFYRVRVGPYRRKQQVASLCRNLQGRGQECFTIRTN